MSECDISTEANLDLMNRKPWDLYDLGHMEAFNANPKDKCHGGYLINWTSINSSFSYLHVIRTQNIEDMLT